MIAATVLVNLLTATILMVAPIDVRENREHDQAFLNALKAHGVEYDTPADAITAAFEVCAELDNGTTPTQAAQAVMAGTTLDPYHAGFFVGAAIAAYCPVHEDQA